MAFWFSPFAPVVVGLVILGVLLVLGRALGVFKGRAGLPYARRARLLTRGELAFFRALEKAVAGTYFICPKVRLGDLLYVPRETPDFLRWFGKVGQKHADFVLADRRTFAPLLVIELDDRSHQRPERRARDDFVDAALGAAGLPILRVTARRTYSTPELAEAIRRRALDPSRIDADADAEDEP